MANPKLKTEAGQGGRLGHSNMTHWTTTEEIKAAARKRRRTEARKIVRSELAELKNPAAEGRASRPAR